MVMNLALVHLPGAIDPDRAQRTNKCTERELEPKTDKPWKEKTLKKKSKKEANWMGNMNTNHDSEVHE